MKSILEKLNDAVARIERVIYLAGAMAATDAFSDDLDDFLDEDEETIINCLGDIPDWVDLDGRSFERANSVFEWLDHAGKFGFLVNFATPVMTPLGKGSSSFSWGYYNTKWIYGDSIEDVVNKGLAWVEERRAREDAKAETTVDGGEA